MQAIAKRVLLIDEDTDARPVLADPLREAAFTALKINSNVSSVLEIVPARLAHIVVLAWQLDARDYTLLLELKRGATTQETLVIPLAASADENDRIVCLQQGVTDLIDKSCTSPELIARIDALLRRTHELPDVITAGDLRLEARSHRVTADEQVVALRPAEFRLLYFFMTHPETVHSRAQLLRCVWQFKPTMERRSVDVHVRRLRKALEPSRCDALIQTVRSVGYRFSTRA